MLALASPTFLPRARSRKAPLKNNTLMFNPAKIVKRVAGSPKHRRETRIFSQQQDTTTPTGTKEKPKSSSSKKTASWMDEKEMSVKDAKEIFQSTLKSKMTIETAELIAKNFESMGIQTPRELRKIVVKQCSQLACTWSFQWIHLMMRISQKDRPCVDAQKQLGVVERRRRC